MTAPTVGRSKQNGVPSGGRRQRRGHLPESSDTFSLNSTLSIIPSTRVPAQHSLDGSHPCLRALVIAKTMSSLKLANFAATNSSAYVHSISFLPNLTLSYSCFKVRTSNARYPPPSSHPSRPSFDRLEDMIKDSMECTDKDYRIIRKKVRTFCTTLYLPCSSCSIRCWPVMVTGA